MDNCKRNLCAYPFPHHHRLYYLILRRCLEIKESIMTNVNFLSQPTNQPASRQVSQSASEPISQSALQPASKPVSQPASQSVCQSVSMILKWYISNCIRHMHPFKSLFQGITHILPVENMTSVLFHNPDSIRVFVTLAIASSIADTMPEKNQWQKIKKGKW